MFNSLTRVGDLRCSSYQLLAQDEILGLRLVNPDRIASSSWIRNATIGRFHYRTAARASSRTRFSGGTGDHCGSARSNSCHADRTKRRIVLSGRRDRQMRRAHQPSGKPCQDLPPGKIVSG